MSILKQQQEARILITFFYKQNNIYQNRNKINIFRIILFIDKSTLEISVVFITSHFEFCIGKNIFFENRVTMCKPIC
jgi:hypothetical protein